MRRALNAREAADGPLAGTRVAGFGAFDAELTERYLAGRTDGLRAAAGEGILLARC